jgi:hypothetical protein
MGSDIYDRLIDQLRDVERKWRPRRTGGIQTAMGGSNGPPSGILSVMGSDGLFAGVQRAMSELDSVNRIRNVLNAIDDSFPTAFTEITKKLRGISIDTIKPILRDMLTDVALYLGGSTALGTGIGGGIGAFAGGVGAIPGAIVGGWLGFELGNVIMALTGLKSVVVFMKDAVPAAIQCYGFGFKYAWGEPNDAAPWQRSASMSLSPHQLIKKFSYGYQHDWRVLESAQRDRRTMRRQTAQLPSRFGQGISTLKQMV